MADGRSRLFLALSVAIPVAAAVFGAAIMGAPPLRIQGAFAVAAAIVLGDLFPIPTRSPIRLTPSFAVVAALAVIYSGGPSEAGATTIGLVAPMALATAVTWVVRTTRKEDHDGILVDSIRFLLGAGSYLFVFFTVGTVAGEVLGSYGDLLAIVLGLVLSFLVTVGAGIIFRFGPRLDSRLNYIRRQFADMPVFLTLLAVGAWSGYVWLEMGAWVLFVGPALYLFAERAFRRLGQARQTYDETIRALARIPEVAHQVIPGHADRTAELAALVARRYRIGPEEMELITRAAYLHDIGRISMNDPAVAGLGATDAEIAGWGAEIVREASLHQEAELIGRQWDVFRHPGQPAESDLALGARIIKVCSAFDDGVHQLGLSPLEAMERLHRGSVYDYDPEVVDRLRAGLEARGGLRNSA